MVSACGMSLLKSAVVVGGNTLLSRVLGFVRDMLVAHALGTGMAADAWVAAFRFPNLFRNIFGEGAMNAAFLPVYAKLRREQNDAAALTFAQHVQAIAVPTVLGLQVLTALAMPWLLLWLTPGFASDTDPQKFALTLKLTLLCLPYPFFLFVMALHGAVLNAHKRFAMAAFVPCVLNVVLSIAVVLPSIWPAAAQVPPAQRLAYACWVSGVVQCYMVWRGMKNHGLTLRWVRPKITPQVQRFLKLLLPALLAGGITQINITISSIIASYQAGAMAYLYYSDRVYQLPLGIIGTALGTVLLPRIAAHMADNQPQQLNALVNKAVAFTVLLTVPCSIMLWMAPQGIVALLFERGAFAAADTLQTARSLAVYAFGLPAFMLLKIFAPVYFARENVRTPTLFAALSALIDIVLAVLLARWLGMGHVGVALATIGAAWINVCQLVRVLYKNKHYAFNALLWGSLWRIALCGAAMLALLWGWPIAAHPSWGMFVVQGTAACAVYAAVMYALGLQRVLKRG